MSTETKMVNFRLNPSDISKMDDITQYVKYLVEKESDGKLRVKANRPLALTYMIRSLYDQMASDEDYLNYRKGNVEDGKAL